MNDFVIGFFAGSSLVALGFIINGINKVLLSLDSVKTNLATLMLYIAKIDKTTMATMAASETFVDSLRMSVEMGGMSRISPTDMKQHFRDLTDKFQDGIDELNNNDEDIDDEGLDDNQPPKEPWKK